MTEPATSAKAVMLSAGLTSGKLIANAFVELPMTIKATGIR